ncbi:MAG: hypothetical protein ABUJ98_12065, partial [Hyphomicrobium sp.]
EEIQPLPEYLRFVLFLYAQALPGVQASNTLFKAMQFVAVHLISFTDAMRRALLMCSSLLRSSSLTTSQGL